MSSREKRGPDVPTRLAKHIAARGDCFETQVYYAKAIDSFAVIDPAAIPRLGRWVAVKQLTAEKIAVERFRGQRYLGVVRILKRFQLSRSGWLIPGIICILI